MRVRKIGNSLQASTITGPTHNLLRLELRKNDGREHAIEVVDLRPADDTPTTVAGDDVKQWVMKAIDELDVPPEQKPIVVQIGYCRDDSNRAWGYERLVAVIVNHYISTNQH